MGIDEMTLFIQKVIRELRNAGFEWQRLARPNTEIREPKEIRKPKAEPPVFGVF
jgi:hypothetical protein